jgi:hypothetical protein
MDGADDGTTICCAAFLQIPSRVKNRRRTLLSHPNRPPPVIFVSPSKKKKRKINFKKKTRLSSEKTFDSGQTDKQTRRWLSFNYSELWEETIQMADGGEKKGANDVTACFFSVWDLFRVIDCVLASSR